MNYVLSHFQAQTLLKAYQGSLTILAVSLDLGISSVEISLKGTGVELPDGSMLGWEDVTAVSQNENACYLVEDGRLEKIQFFSETLNRVYTLYPTSSAPTMLISGIPMHRIKGVDPMQDTHEKIKSIAPLTGTVLDTATGLGYTAIAAAETAESVTTIELDPTVLELCRLNPWSQKLFDHPRIEQLIGDTWDVIETLPDESYSRILHDPPVFSLAGHLYSGDFYRELFRVLKRNGRLFHYIGDPNSKSGRNTTRGVIKRLQEAGFGRVVHKPKAFGVAAYK
ncbi:MAG: methyltransferase domain-containing protein [Candidatus Promineifilaceae bacterium]